MGVTPSLAFFQGHQTLKPTYLSTDLGMEGTSLSQLLVVEDYLIRLRLG